MAIKFNAIRVEEKKLVLSQKKELKIEIFFNELERVSIALQKKPSYLKFLLYFIPFFILANYFVSILSAEINFIIVYF